MGKLKLSGSFTEEIYDVVARHVIAAAWAEFEGDAWNVAGGERYPRSAFYVDDNLIVTIVSMDGSEFRTCYHEHFDRKHGQALNVGVEIGDRQLRFKEMLKNEVRGKGITNLRRIRGV